MERLQKFAPIIMLVLLIFLLMGTCSNARRQRMILEKVEQIDADTSRHATSITVEQMEMLLKKQMYESLILEEDVDKGNISISDIKRKKVESDQ